MIINWGGVVIKQSERLFQAEERPENRLKIFSEYQVRFIRKKKYRYNLKNASEFKDEKENITSLS